jgi:hypothetical protein
LSLEFRSSLSMAILFSPRVEHLKGASLGLGQALALPANTRLGWKGWPGTNTSLLWKSVNYGCIKFYDTLSLTSAKEKKVLYYCHLAITNKIRDGVSRTML